jgi:hypothetical protein
MATPDYTVNYDDERLQRVEDEEAQDTADLEKTYTEMIDGSDKYYEDLIQNTKDWKDEQTRIQNEQTEFTIDQIEQQKEQAHKDYIKEQSGAYVDWQKQSNQYGVNAEKMAANGLQNTGYSETSQVSMYNTYQNRVATAREVFSKATLNYDNAMTEARLQNSAALAQIAYQAFQQQLELSLQGFQYKNSLISDLTDKKMQVKQLSQNKWLSILDQINKENTLAEQVRQFNEEMARLKAKDAADAKRAAAALAEEKRQFDLQMEQQKAQINKTGSTGSKNQIKSASQLISEVKNGSNNNKSSSSIKVNSPYTVETVAKKVADGELIVTKEEGNKVWVAPNPNYVKGQSTLDKYTWLK